MKKNKKSTLNSSATLDKEDGGVVIVGDCCVAAPELKTAETMQVQKYAYFVTPVYQISKPEFLPAVRDLSTKLLKDHEKEFPNLNPVYPLRQSTSMLDHDSIKDFIDFVGGTAWNAMQSEGYAMDQFSVVFQEMWVQEHHMHSGHDEHVHAYGSQLVGFYFLDAPENSGRLCLHDPRPAKKQINLPETNINMVSDASSTINFEPKAGDLYFVPSWVPHSISRHGGATPLRLVHITLSVMPNEHAHAPHADSAANQATVI